MNKLEKPSTYISSALIKQNKKTVDYFVKQLGISKADADEIIHNDLTYHELLNLLKKELDMQMVTEIMPLIQRKVKDKLEEGSMEQAQKGMTALAIASDKVFGNKENQRYIHRRKGCLGGETIDTNNCFIKGRRSPLGRRASPGASL